MFGNRKTSLGKNETGGEIKYIFMPKPKTI